MWGRSFGFREVCRTQFTLRALLRDSVGRVRRRVRSVLKPRRDLRRIDRFPILGGQQSSDLIAELIQSEAPFLVSRLGTTEMKALRVSAQRVARPREMRLASHNLSQLSGVYPENQDTLSLFSSRYSDWIGEIDTLGVRENRTESSFWNLENFCVKNYFRGSKLISIEDLFPIDHQRPWTRELSGRKVLVVHPFDASIRAQAENMRSIFPAGQVPEFSIATFKPPQLLAYSAERSNYSSWFHAFDESLSSLKELAETFRPEVVLIGAGALGLGYGVALRSWGHGVIHVGGALQLFFGIWGRRWDQDARLLQFSENPHWRRPARDEAPQGAETVERGVYW